MKKALSAAAIVTSAVLLSACSHADNKAAGLALKSEPNASSHTITKLEPNEKLIKIFEKDGWIKVGVAKNGDAGWVTNETYQQVTSPKPAKPEAEKPTDQKLTLSGKDNSEPQTNITIKEGEDNGVKYKIIEKNTSYQTHNAKQIEDMMARMHQQQMEMIKQMNQSFNQFQKQMFNDPFFQNQDAESQKTK